jgi:hypothetical protein
VVKISAVGFFRFFPLDQTLKIFLCKLCEKSLRALREIFENLKELSN